MKSVKRRIKESIGDVRTPLVGKQTAETNVSWLNLIRLTSSTAHLKGRRKPCSGARRKRKEPLSVEKATEAVWINHIVLDMLVCRWQNDNKLLEKWGKYNWSQGLFPNAGMKTAKGVMRLKKNEMKVHYGSNAFPHICGANMQLWSLSLDAPIPLRPWEISQIHNHLFKC